MHSSTIGQSEPSITEDRAREWLRNHYGSVGSPDIYEPLVYCSWPQEFGSTCGPWPGIGGQAMTLLRMEAWLSVYSGIAVIFCGGRFVEIKQLNITATTQN